MDLLEKCPGAISGCLTKIIFVRMLRHIGKISDFPSAINDMRPKFNDSLNNSVAKINEHMLTIINCNQYEHFTYKGTLSGAGKLAYFDEVDDLICCFDLNKIKLLPTPIHGAPRAKNNYNSCGHLPQYEAFGFNFNNDQHRNSYNDQHGNHYHTYSTYSHNRLSEYNGHHDVRRKCNHNQYYY